MSEHFDVGDFACHDGTPYPAEWVDGRLAPLLDTLETLRARWGGPLVVLSGYRTPEYNTRIGGAKHSQHMEGRAADIRPIASSPERVAALHTLAFGMANLGFLPRLGGLGVYPGWIHVDTREQVPAGHIARWRGAGVGAER